jgi:hypothetical protein
MRRWLFIALGLWAASFSLPLALVIAHVRPLLMAVSVAGCIMLATVASLKYVSLRSEIKMRQAAVSPRVVSDETVLRRRRGIAAGWLGVLYFSLASANALRELVVGHKTALYAVIVHLVLLASIIAVMIRLRKASKNPAGEP